MSAYTARVENGRIVMDDPATDLPEGTELRLVVEESDDLFAGLSPEERADREARLARSWAQAQRGETRDAREIVKELRARRGL